MAAKHILSLEVPTVANCEILKIVDTSQYASNLNIDCSQLVLTPPGSVFIAPIEVQPGFDLNVNTCAVASLLIVLLRETVFQMVFILLDIRYHLLIRYM